MRKLETLWALVFFGKVPKLGLRVYFWPRTGYFLERSKNARYGRYFWPRGKLRTYPDVIVWESAKTCIPIHIEPKNSRHTRCFLPMRQVETLCQMRLSKYAASKSEMSNSFRVLVVFWRLVWFIHALVLLLFRDNIYWCWSTWFGASNLNDQVHISWVGPSLDRSCAQQLITDGWDLGKLDRDLSEACKLHTLWSFTVLIINFTLQPNSFTQDRTHTATNFGVDPLQNIGWAHNGNDDFGKISSKPFHRRAGRRSRETSLGTRPKGGG